jgi:FKBP-type peptidyl-prolyl cis-trans isomerase
MYKNICYIILLLSLFSCDNQQPQIPYNKLPKSKLKDNLVEMNKLLAEKEDKDILLYIKKNNLDVKKSPLYFWYQIEEKGDGAPIKTGNKVHIMFNLSLLDGTVCYTPKYKGSQDLTIGHVDIIKGLDEALLLLHDGGKAKFIIPSTMAFGIVGDEDRVGSKKTVVYDILSVEIIQ